MSLAVPVITGRIERPRVGPGIGTELYLAHLVDNIKLMFKNKKSGISFVSAAIALSFAFASAASALTVTCVGTPTQSNITWTGSALAGIDPVGFLWGNGATSSTQVVVVSPGTYTMNLQVTDASSSVATTTCAATVVAPAPVVPTVTSFAATPTTITAGQSSILSWAVSNASSTVINNGVGIIAATSVVVTPTVTTTYTLSAVNPAGTTTATAIVTVNPVTPPPTATTTVSQIQNLLNQIAALKAQILQLLLQNQGGGVGSGTGTNTSATSSPFTCFNFNRDLKRGHGGDDVRQLQLMLAADPTFMTSEFATGFFGKKTEEALKKFQRKFGIGSTGFFGPLSRKYFKEQCQDTDHDGVLNISDSDDDNDGIIDTSDPHPLIPESKFSSTTRERENEDHGGKNR